MSILTEELNRKENKGFDKNKKNDKIKVKTEKKKEKEMEIRTKKEIREIGEKVKTIPISSIILSRLDHNADGSCCCPFHNDTSTGSFHYDDQKNWFKCFSCNKSGDGINFIEALEGKGYSEAVAELAGEYGIITKEKYKELTGDDFDKVVKDFKPVVLLEKLDKERDAVEITDCVLKTVLKNAPLSDEHREYLKKRGLSEEKIKEKGYFTIPRDHSAIENSLNNPIFREELINIYRENYPKKVFDPKNIRVPGIYTDEKGNFHLTAQFGLGIPIRDINNKIQAVQIRRDKVAPGEVRYLWWTSNKFDRGATPGCPVDVHVPRNKDNKIALRNNDLLISEGHFKAQTLAERVKSISISVQGVQNIKELDTQLREIYEKPNLRFNRVRIFYDMDIYKNENIFIALKNLYEDLNGPEAFKASSLDRCYNPDGTLEPYPMPFTTYTVRRLGTIQVGIWDPEKGKGVDDYFEAGNKSILYIPCEEFLRRYQDEYLKREEFKQLKTLLKKVEIVGKGTNAEVVEKIKEGKTEGLILSPELQQLANEIRESDEKCRKCFESIFITRK